MFDLSRSHFVIACQAGENRQARCVHRSPSPGTLLVPQEVPHYSYISVPTAISIRECAPHLIKKTVGIVEHQHMAVAGSSRTTFNRSTAGDRHESRIAL